MWFQLVGQLVGQAAKPVNVSAPNPAQYELPTSPLTVVAAVAGVGAVGVLVWWALK